MRATEDKVGVEVVVDSVIESCRGFGRNHGGSNVNRENNAYSGSHGGFYGNNSNLIPRHHEDGERTSSHGQGEMECSRWAGWSRSWHGRRGQDDVTWTWRNIWRFKLVVGNGGQSNGKAEVSNAKFEVELIIFFFF
jgi:hypothetical protein